MNPYSVLGVSKDSPIADIKAAYRALAKRHHPDTGGSAEKFMAIQSAFDLIMKSAKNDVSKDGGYSSQKRPSSDPVIIHKSIWISLSKSITGGFMDLEVHEKGVRTRIIVSPLTEDLETARYSLISPVDKNPFLVDVKFSIRDDFDFRILRGTGDIEYVRPVNIKGASRIILPRPEGGHADIRLSDTFIERDLGLIAVPGFGCPKRFIESDKTPQRSRGNLLFRGVLS